MKSKLAIEMRNKSTILFKVSAGTSAIYIIMYTMNAVE